MRTTILYASVVLAVVQVYYLAQLAAQHEQRPAEDGAAAVAEAFARRPLRARDYAEAPRHEAFAVRDDAPHAAAHAQRRDFASRDALVAEHEAVAPEVPAPPQTRRPASRSERIEAFVRHIHAKFAHIRPAGFGVRNDPHRVSDGTVWQTFYDAVEGALSGPYAELALAPSEPVREDGSVFLSISSFRDEVCPDTLENAFATASAPDRVFVGLVQQNCDQKQHDAYGCKTAVMPSDMRPHDMDADVDCVRAYCARPHATCDMIRVVRFNESETFGPVFGRYLGSQLWKGETYYMQVDAHTTFAKGWDDVLREDYALAPSKKAIFSHYPPSGPQKPALPLNGKHPWELSVGPCMCDGEFAEYGILRVGAMRRYPMKETVGDCKMGTRGCLHVPRYAPFIGAGFVFAHASFIKEVPFDPYLPFIFMGEELNFGARAFTHGWDIFCPPRSVVAHAYLRKQKPKFWGALQRSIGAGTHNSLQKFVLPRVKHMVGYPENEELSSLAAPSLIGHLETYGLGAERPVSAYRSYADLDFATKRHAHAAWCSTGDRPPGFEDAHGF